MAVQHKPGRNPYLVFLDALSRDRIVANGPTFVSLFSGGGGLDLGLSLAGWTGVFSTDIEPSYLHTVADNLAHTHTLVADVASLSGELIRAEAGMGTDDLDLVAAGPPCQPFSILGRRGSVTDPRGRLVWHFARIVKELSPRAFLFENVPGIRTLNGGRDWLEILNLFTDETGYELQEGTLNALHFGAPQRRERVFVVGLREAEAQFSFPEPEYGDEGHLFELKPAFPSKYALDDVAGLPNHDIREHGPRVRARYERVPQGARDATDHTDRVEADKPSGTVLVGSAAGGGRPHIHPYHPRVITVREAARLQTFPDWYTFKGTSTSQYRQVGNAVPPVLGMSLGQEIARALGERLQQP